MESSFTLESTVMKIDRDKQRQKHGHAYTKDHRNDNEIRSSGTVKAHNEKDWDANDKDLKPNDQSEAKILAFAELITDIPRLPGLHTTGQEANQREQVIEQGQDFSRVAALARGNGIAWIVINLDTLKLQRCRDRANHQHNSIGSEEEKEGTHHVTFRDSESPALVRAMEDHVDPSELRVQCGKDERETHR